MAKNGCMDFSFKSIKQLKKSIYFNAIKGRYFIDELHSLYFRTNGFYVWFPSILNSLANHAGGDARICDILDAARVPASNGTVVSEQ